MPARKHVPQRMCVVCHETKSKRELTRIVKTPEGVCLIDKTGKASGRGAYLCQRLTCWQKGLSKNFINRTLRTSISDQDLQSLHEQMQGLDFIIAG